MRGKELLARMREEVLIGDGALGTLISERGLRREGGYERLNLTNPDFIRDIHTAYVEAGALLIETNTFGANRSKLLLGGKGNDLSAHDVADINRAGVELARIAAGQRAFVAGAVGPLAERAGPQDTAPLTENDVRSIFQEQIVALADAGVDVLLLETFSELPQLLLALAVAKTHTDLPVICQMAFHERGYTYTGVPVQTALDALVRGGADVVGANCGRGVRCVMSAVEGMVGLSDCLVSAFPNAGLPEYVEGRYIFGAPLPYLVDRAEEMTNKGVNLIGGCCGTTPEYIKRIAERLQGRRPAARSRIHIAQAPPATIPAVPVDLTPVPPANSILQRLPLAPAEQPARPLIVVELDPPHDLNFEHIVKRSQQLRDMGVDAITMADNPVATLHMGNMSLAQIVQREADIPVIVHLTCRDHNLLGLQSLLMSAHVMKLDHILALTGDPARVGNQPGATSVYDLNSFGLIDLINKFNSGVTNAGMSLGRRTRFTIGVAFNPNGRNMVANVAKLRKKIAAGAHFAMTQPFYDTLRFEQMREATAELRLRDQPTRRFPILAGLMPLLSERNAEYLHNEVPGIVLTDEVRLRMKGLTGPAGRAMGLRICEELMDHLVTRADGFYLIPSQKRTEMAVEMVAYLNQRLPRHE